MRKFINFTIVLLLLLISCEIDNVIDSCPDIYPIRNADKVTISQGVWGDVWFWEGNFMPSDSCTTGTISPVQREIYIHSLTSLSDVEENSPSFYSNINTPLIAVSQSDSNGFFQIELPPGFYSIFVKEDGLFYSKYFSSDNFIYPFEVKSNTVTGILFDINYSSYW